MREKSPESFGPSRCRLLITEIRSVSTTRAAKWRSERIQDELRDWRINRQIKRGNSPGGDRTKEKRQGGCRWWEDGRRESGELGGERVESSACGPRGNIFTLPSSFSSLFLPPLFLPCSFAPPPPLLVHVSPFSPHPAFVLFFVPIGTRCTPNENLSIAVPCRRI